MAGKRTVRFLKPAERELYGSTDRYNEQRSGRGDNFLREVRDAVEDIAAYPIRWPGSTLSHRRVLTKFPFTIHYRFGTKELVILAVAHEKRRPGYWVRRR
ncbi:MAG TPA: type II toxin-antitoxin system RelE/ParE family toxin [Polyangia bacterium]